MKSKITFLWIFLCCMLTATTYGQTQQVSQLEALRVARQQFQGQDVDYFILDNGNLNTWTIFVDAEPMKGWEHDCYILTIPRSVSSSVVPKPLSRVKRKLPPTGNYKPLYVRNRYGTNADSKPKVSKATLSNAAKTAAQRTYAVILSGGVNKLSNHERYWNDCSFIYQTLVNTYGVPKDNIYPIMSDGTNPAEDVLCTTGGFKSQTLDLDGDGTNDIKLAATKANVSATLKSLSNILKEDDHLFFFVIDHGGSSDNNTQSYINLWGNELLKDNELADMLDPFTKKYVNVNVVLGQCFAGGFVDNLNKIGCVVATAANGSEYSWSCSDIPYDEFVYHWTCAVNGANHRNVSVNADTDANGRVTMDEAFAYAKSKDRQKEHPMFNSNPISVGEDLAFNNLASAVDLYIKDNPEDTGKEPNMTTDKFWLSPSIWVRNNADGICEHENPFYSTTHTSATVYVRVHNRGKKDYPGGTIYVHLYWAKASTGFRPQAWMGNEVYTDGAVTGGPLTPSLIRTRIPAGGYADVAITWGLPADLLGTSADNGSENHHFCLLAQLSNTNIEPWHDGTFSYNKKYSNNDAQKNVSIISQKELNSGTSVYVRNVYDINKKYTLELVPRTSDDEAIYSHAAIEMELSKPIYTAWKLGGSQSNNVIQSLSTDSRKVQFLSKDSRLESILLKGREFDKITMRFNFKLVSAIPRNYTLDLIQRDENGEIIGGETFVVKSPTTTFKPIDIIASPSGNNGMTLSTDAEEGSSIRWENNDGMAICYENTLTLNTPSQNSTYHAYCINEEGELSTGSITLDAQVEISHVSVENNNLVVCLTGSAQDNSSISISSVATGELVCSEEVEIGRNHCKLDVSTLQNGIYVVYYVHDGIIVNSTKFTK